MISTRFDNISSGDPNKDLSFVEEFPNCITIGYTPPQHEVEISILTDDEKKHARSFKHELMMINGQDDFVSIYPINTLPTHPNFLKQKYNQIKSITLDGFGFLIPETIDVFLALLEELPNGFIKRYEYGLGLKKDYRFIIHAIENIPEIKHVIVSKNNDTNVKGDIYTLSSQDFEAIRKGINRITTTHQEDGRLEKTIFSHNSLLHQLAPTKYEEKQKPYEKDVIYKFVSGTSINPSSLSKTDAEAVVKMLSDNKQGVYKKKRESILQLQQDIELLNLEWIIKETERLISQKTPENKWQKFLNDNPFILSLVFGYPVIKIQDQASVGGRKLTGSGDKITDYLIKNNLTNNTALVEIKKSYTPLIQKKTYRDGVYAPSTELAGSVTQILDQKYKFQKEISSIKDNSGIYDIESYLVDCVLIIGTLPIEKEKIKSFELYRGNMRDVRIVTFDELLNKLKDIYMALKPEPLE